jgi:hypothetical protein
MARMRFGADYLNHLESSAFPHSDPAATFSPRRRRGRPRSSTDNRPGNLPPAWAADDECECEGVSEVDDKPR